MNGAADEGTANGRFEAAADASHWTYAGALTFDNAAGVVEAAQSLPLPGSGRIDLSGIENADSSALAVLFALKRRASAEGRRLAFEGMPASLASLAQVYGVTELLTAPH